MFETEAIFTFLLERFNLWKWKKIVKYLRFSVRSFQIWVCTEWEAVTKWTKGAQFRRQRKRFRWWNNCSSYRCIGDTQKNVEFCASGGSGAFCTSKTLNVLFIGIQSTHTSTVNAIRYFGWFDLCHGGDGYFDIGAYKFDWFYFTIENWFYHIIVIETNITRRNRIV